MKKIYIYAWGGLIFLYFLKILYSYINFDFDFSYGYYDHQLYYQTLLDFLQGKVLYKNLFWEYNVLPILIRLPFFLLLQKSFFASIFINLIIIPVIGIILSFYIGKQLLERKALFLYGVLLLFMGTNSNFSSIRYLIPELGLLMLMMGIENKDKKKTIIGSIIMGISLLTSVEYAIAGQIGLAVYFFSVLFVRKKLIKEQWLVLLIAEVLVGSAFIIYLISNNTVQNFIRFYSEFTHTFYSESPCRAFFPRFNQIERLKANPLATIVSWNYYVVPFFIVATGVWIFFKKNIRYKMVLIPLVVYSLFAASRIFTTPCYYAYALTFPFLILSYLIFQVNTGRLARVLFMGIAFWFIFTSIPSNLILSVSGQSYSNSEKEFLPGANIYLNKKLVREYKEITSYIQTHTRADEYVYVHKVGPYNQLAGRRSPVSAATGAVYEVAPFLVDLTLTELKQNPPSLVIINTYNGDSPSNSVRNIRYNVHRAGDTIIFEGDITPIEDYISQNYSLDKTYEIAWVLKRRNVPITLIPYYIPVTKPIHWEIGTDRLQRKIDSSNNTREYTLTDINPIISVRSSEIKNAEHAEIPIKIDIGLIKPISKFNIGLYIIINTNQTIHLYNNAISTDMTNEWFYIPRKEFFPKGIEVAGVAVIISENYGFLPWGKPVSIKLNTPKLYIKNPQLGETIKAYKKNY